MDATFDVTWGQLAQYDHLVSNGFDADMAHLSAVWSVPPDADQHIVERALRLLVERHESLRTVFSEDRSTDYPVPRVRQRVLDPTTCVLTVQLVSTRDKAEIARVVDQTRPRRLDPLDPATVRCILVSCRSGFQAVVFHVSHMAVDYAGLTVLEAEFQASLLAFTRGLRAELAPVRNPREQRAAEALPRVGRRNEAARRHFDAVLQGAPPVFLATLSARASQSHTVTSGIVPALTYDALVLARAHRVSLPGIMCGLLTLALSAATGEERVVLRSLYSRRQWSRGESYVAPHALAALLELRVDPGFTVTEFLMATRESTLRGYRHTDYNPRELDAAQREAEQRRGVEFDGYSLFNFLHPPEVAPAIPIARPTASTHESMPTIIPKNYRFMFMGVWSNECDALFVELRTEKNFLGMEAGPSLIWLEKIARAAAGSPDRTIREVVARAND